MTRARELAVVAGTLCLGSGVALGDGSSAPGATSASPETDRSATRPESPRWMYQIEGGVFEPDLDQYAMFYGSRHATLYGIAFGYRLRDWIELGGDVGRMSDRGTGTIEGKSTAAGEVEYELTPVQLFATFTLDRPDRAIVPYLRLGLATAFYDETIELQPSRNGRGDVGAAVGIGMRWRFAENGSRERRRDGVFWRSYVFVEAQRFSSDAETSDGGTVDLGGTAYLTGIRVEFELGPGG
ncbi:MAG TPA: outer membrane beta-barrel protein [Gammaproteobacteria bacterium]|nr:outer membrane beta-barrel protein [Gammaproteobacteria bacterium]